MIKLCVKLDEKREVNKMTAYNISTVLGPNLLYGTDMNPSKSHRLNNAVLALTIRISYHGTRNGGR
jgi:hypothetical protein